MRGYWMSILSLSAVFLVHGHAQAQWSLDPTVNTPVCTATNDQEQPVIVSDGAGGTIIAWQDYRSGTNTHVYAQRIDASGVARWTANGIDLCTAPGDHYYQLPINRNGGMMSIVLSALRNGRFFSLVEDPAAFWRGLSPLHRC